MCPLGSQFEVNVRALNANATPVSLTAVVYQSSITVPHL